MFYLITPHTPISDPLPPYLPLPSLPPPLYPPPSPLPLVAETQVTSPPIMPSMASVTAPDIRKASLLIGQLDGARAASLGHVSHFLSRNESLHPLTPSDRAWITDLISERRCTLYIAYVMLIWAAPIPSDRWGCSLWP